MLTIGPRINISESAAHIAVSGTVVLIKKVTIIYCPQATTVAVKNPPIKAPLTPPVELPNTPATAPWKKERSLLAQTRSQLYFQVLLTR